MKTRLQVDIEKDGIGYRYWIRVISIATGKCLRVILTDKCESRRDAELESKGALAAVNG